MVVFGIGEDTSTMTCILAWWIFIVYLKDHDSEPFVLLAGSFHLDFNENEHVDGTWWISESFLRNIETYFSIVEFTRFLCWQQIVSNCKPWTKLCECQIMTWCRRKSQGRFGGSNMQSTNPPKITQEFRFQLVDRLSNMEKITKEMSPRMFWVILNIFRLTLRLFLSRTRFFSGQEMATRDSVNLYRSPITFPYISPMESSLKEGWHAEQHAFQVGLRTENSEDVMRDKTGVLGFSAPGGWLVLVFWLVHQPILGIAPKWYFVFFWLGSAGRVNQQDSNMQLTVSDGLCVCVCILYTYILWFAIICYNYIYTQYIHR